jgi:hypothetical protein
LTGLLSGGDPATGRLDYDKIQEIATKNNQKLFAGASHILDMDLSFAVVRCSFFFLIFHPAGPF